METINLVSTDELVKELTNRFSNYIIFLANDNDRVDDVKTIWQGQPSIIIGEIEVMKYGIIKNLYE